MDKLEITKWVREIAADAVEARYGYHTVLGSAVRGERRDCADASAVIAVNAICSAIDERYEEVETRRAANFERWPGDFDTCYSGPAVTLLVSKLPPAPTKAEATDKLVAKAKAIGGELAALAREVEEAR